VVFDPGKWLYRTRSEGDGLFQFKCVATLAGVTWALKLE
jgi:hypothetical protein